MTTQQAKDTLANLGLNPSIKEVSGSGPKQGTVIESRPAAGVLVSGRAPWCCACTTAK